MIDGTDIQLYIIRINAITAVRMKDVAITNTLFRLLDCLDTVSIRVSFKMALVPSFLSRLILLLVIFPPA